MPCCICMIACHDDRVNIMNTNRQWSYSYLQSFWVTHKLLHCRVLHLLQHLGHHLGHLLLHGGVPSKQGVVGEHGGSLVRIGCQAREHTLHVGGAHHLGHEGGVVPHLTHETLHTRGCKHPTILTKSTTQGGPCTSSGWGRSGSTT